MCCFCFVVSVFVAFGVRTQQLCFCFVASVVADVASGFDAVVFARSLARSLALSVSFSSSQTRSAGCIHNSLDNNKQLKHNKHTYKRYTFAIMSYSSRKTISIHYVSICIHIFERKRGLIRHDRL